MKEILWVAIGSAMGGSLRYGIMQGIDKYLPFSPPIATCFINTIGCFILGFLLGFMPLQENASLQSLRLCLMVGFCGSFTTFSTFVKDFHTLLQHPFSAFTYLFISMGFGFFAFIAGLWLAKY